MGFWGDVFDIANAMLEANNAKKDNEDLLKSLVFVAGFHTTFDKQIKKVIISMMQIFVNEEYTLFEHEPELDSIYKTVNSMNAKQFIAKIVETRIDRDRNIVFYAGVLALIYGLKVAEILEPQNLYNLYLIKEHFNFSRSELTKCYKLIAVWFEEDFDKIAEGLEAMTSAEAMQLLFEHYPEFMQADASNSQVLEIQEEDDEDVTRMKFQKQSDIDTRMQIKDAFRQFRNRINKVSLISLAFEKPEKTRQVIKGYAKDAGMTERPILIYDNSIGENCKTGFFITDKKVYAKNDFSFSKICISLPDAEDVTFKVSLLSKSIFFDDQEVQTEQVGGDGTEQLFNLVKFVIGEIKKCPNLSSIPTMKELLNGE